MMKRHVVHALFPLALTLAAWAGCSTNPSTDHAAATPAFLDTPVAPRPAASSDTIAQGKALYDANCAHCHGEQGRGDGYGAPFLVPPPRDFTAAYFKFRTTASGALPSDDDLFRTISRGASGTGMPPWQYLLSEQERWALVDYIKSFSPKFEAAHVRTAIALPAAPGRSRDATRGRSVYADLRHLATRVLVLGDGRIAADATGTFELRRYERMLAGFIWSHDNDHTNADEGSDRGPDDGVDGRVYEFPRTAACADRSR